MLFNSIDFLIFFPIVVLLYFVLPHRVRWLWLLAASYYFYMCWNPKYAVLIALSTLITYLSGLLISRADAIPDAEKRKRRKKLWVALSFISNLAILAFFKYFTFLLDNIAALFGIFGVTLHMPVFDILLPVGISFYTFQALSYTMDVYRGEIDAEPNLLRYALFVSFFPQLVAGPIERSKNLLLQVHEHHTFDADRARNGLLLMLWGLIQKIVIADRVSVIVDAVFDGWNTMPAWAIVLAVVLFAFQIYCDFGGYSNIAIGAAEVMGFRLMENFRQPYLSRSCAEFWRRWHISLSTWFRDYLYIPLGGSRCSRLRRYFNLMVTFLASGLWHGAQWSYVAWGALNGAFQVIGDILKPLREKLCAALRINRETRLWHAVQMIVTFCFIDFAWLFFRAPSFMTAVHMIAFALRGGAVGAVPDLGLVPAELVFTAVAVIGLIIVDLLHERRPLRPVITRRKTPVRWAVYLVGIYIVLIFGMYGPGFSEAQFIYFQF